MLCQECNNNIATIRVRKTINGEKQEMYLCETCAKEVGDYFMEQSNPLQGINPLLASLLNSDNIIGKKQTKQELLQCPKCKMTFKQFQNVTKFGCVECYETFLTKLEPVFRKVQSGNTVHTGKIPKRAGGSIQIQREIGELRRKLDSQIKNEEFENAAVTRDEIRELEKQLGGENHAI